MTLAMIYTEPAILIITAIFMLFIIITLASYNRTAKNLNSIYQLLKSIADSVFVFDKSKYPNVMINDLR